MNVFELFAKLNLDSKGYERSLTTAEKRLNAFGRNAQRIGTSLTAAVTAPIAGLSALAVRAFGEQERAELQLRAALEANGREVDLLFDRYTSLASALQDVTVIGDETTIRMFSQAEALGLTGEAAERAVRNAIGLSSALDLNARSALRYTAVLEEGDTTMLQRYLPALRSIEDESEKVAVAQEMLANMFGSATAEAEAASGQIIQMRNAVGDLLEVVGGIVSEALLPFVNRLQDLAERAQELDEDVLRLVVQVGALAAAIGPALVVIGLMATGLGAVVGALTTAGPVIALVVAVLITFREQIGNILTALVNLAENWPVFVEGLQDSWSAFVDYFKAESDRMFASFDLFTSSIRVGMAGAAIDALQSVEKLINGVIRLFNGFIRRTNEVFGTSLSLAEEFDVTQTAIFQRLERTYKSSADAYLDAADRQVEATGRAEDAVERLEDGLGTAASAFTDLSDDAEDSAGDAAGAFTAAAADVASEVEGMVASLTSGVERMVSRSIEQILRFRPAIREVVGRGPGERGEGTGPDPFAEQRAQERIEARRRQENELQSVRELSAMREADLTRRYENEVLARDEAAKRDAEAREDALERQQNALSNALDFAESLGTRFSNNVRVLEQAITDAFKTMVTNAGDSVEEIANKQQAAAQVITAALTTFASGIGQMISGLQDGEASAGQALAKMVLSIINTLSAMILAVSITASVMAGQIWNPWLIGAGLLGVAAASYGMDRLRRLGAKQSEPPAPPSGSIDAMEDDLMELRDERDAATNQAERDRLNAEIEELENRIAEARGQEPIGGDTGADTGANTGADTGADRPSDRDVGASFGGTSQGVQLAVAVPLMDAATIMQSAARSIQQAFQTDGGMTFGAATMSFDSSVDRFGSYVDRLVDTGISVNVQGVSRTAAFR